MIFSWKKEIHSILSWEVNPKLGIRFWGVKIVWLPLYYCGICRIPNSIVQTSYTCLLCSILTPGLRHNTNLVCAVSRQIELPTWYWMPAWLEITIHCSLLTRQSSSLLNIECLVKTVLVKPFLFMKTKLVWFGFSLLSSSTTKNVVRLNTPLTKLSGSAHEVCYSIL